MRQVGPRQLPPPQMPQGEYGFSASDRVTLIIKQAAELPDRQWRNPPAPSAAPRRTLRQPPRRMQAPGQHPQDTPTTARWMRHCRELYVGTAGCHLEDPWRRLWRHNHGSALPEWGETVQSCRRQAIQEDLCRMRRGTRQTTTRAIDASCSGTPWRRRWWECWRTFERVSAASSLGEDAAHGNTSNITRQLCVCLC